MFGSLCCGSSQCPYGRDEAKAGQHSGGHCYPVGHSQAAGRTSRHSGHSHGAASVCMDVHSQNVKRSATSSQ